jgi:hypothetical protein
MNGIRTRSDAVTSYLLLLDEEGRLESISVGHPRTYATGMLPLFLAETSVVPSLELLLLQFKVWT